MTRDEAIAKCNDCKSGGNGWLVDVLTAFGILKLDEPKSAVDKFHDAMIERGYVPNSVAWSDILPALESAGLKIVEK